ncbi:thioredoxin family protein [Oceanicella actignis]|uniref:Small redox-active disulfide protein 2 n=1 Tax=Oceanicella actignis TaxID=1189325 RepID=A0A1M7SPI5_9RHOB|nr:thioredoxin family protein [Oceanicella actignis]SES65907.1 small redox-active disulfide protein 2 [Oceanicella actignis]SHN60362.1 small redox-active disulfide protein 2 [Oceanicella actignis]
MKNVIVYGPGCKRCEAAREMVEAAARKLGVEVQVSKETDYARIAMAGVASTPGIAIDGRLVHAGGLPKEADVEAWLSA